MLCKFFFAILVSILPMLASAQFKNIMKRVENKVKQRADQKVDREIDKGLDKAEDATKKKSSDSKSSSESESKSTVEEQEDPKSEEPVTKASTEPSKSQPSLKSYSKFDFIPGERIIYSEDFAQDEIGELPMNWNTGGKAELVTLNNFPGKWLRLFENATYLTSNKDSFSTNFTMEFDIILAFTSNGYTYPMVSFGFLSSNDKASNDNFFLEHYEKYQAAEIMFRPSAGGQSSIYTVTYLNGGQHFSSETQNLAGLEDHYHKVTHVAIQVQGPRFRCWINGEKKYDLPMALGTSFQFNQLFFKVGSSSYKDDELGVYVSNLKVATGKADSRHKLVDEGKFSTTGILFDVNSANIKPESAGTLKDIASILTKNPEISVKVIGHTDNDGADDKNLELSKKRAAAVVRALQTEYGIDESRLKSEGKGETEPVADNNKREGKAQNRRVEFVKL